MNRLRGGRYSKAWRAGSAALIAVSLVTACSSAATPGPSSANAASAKAALPTEVALGAPTASSCAGEKQYYIYFATHAFPHPFFAVMQKGAEDGARDACMKMKWTQSPSGYDINDTVSRMEAAIAEKPDILVIAAVDPAAEKAAVDEAVSDGIAVIDVNAADAAPVPQRLPYVIYIGANEYQTGVAAAEEVLKQGKPHLAVCADQVPGQLNLTERCQGWGDTMKAAGVTTDILNDAQNTQQVIDAYILAHPQTDALYTLAVGANGSGAALAVMKDRGLFGKLWLVTSDTSAEDLQAIKAGQELAGIDQQQYLQGYLPSILGRLYLEHALMPNDIYTGPGVIDKANVDAVIAGTAAGYR